MRRQPIHRNHRLRARLKSSATTGFFSFLTFAILSIALDEGPAVLRDINAAIALASLLTAGVSFLGLFITRFIARRES